MPRFQAIGRELKFPKLLTLKGRCALAVTRVIIL